MELVDFLRARLDEDEAAARSATPGVWRYSPGKHHHIVGTPLFEEAVFAGPPGVNAVCVAGTGETDDPQSMRDAEHIARHDPARVLAEVEAKRAVVDAYRPPGADPHPGQPCINYDGQDPADYDASDACARHVEASKTHLHHDYVLRLLARPFRAHPDFDPAWLED